MGKRFRVMEKKLTNSDPFRESVDKHSIYHLPCPEPIARMHCGQRWEEGGASDVSLIPGSPQDLLLTEQALGVREASASPHPRAIQAVHHLGTVAR
jgi:hypothetical protein